MMDKKKDKPIKQDKKKTRDTEILVVTHYYAAHGGGIERITEKLITEIGKRINIHFTWASSKGDALPEILGHAVMPMKAWNGIEKAIGLPWPIWSIKSLKKLRRAIKKTDVLWLQDTLYPGNIMAFWMARWAKKPIVITQHIEAIPYKNPLLRFMMKVADKWITRPMLKKADQAVFISDRVADDYYHAIAFDRAVSVIPNGLDLKTYRLPEKRKRSWVREQFSLRQDQPVLLFVGRFVERKGLDVIKRLATKMPHYRFWLAGKGTIDPEAWMLPNVHVFRDRSGESLTELYWAADLLILPSYGEGFPLVAQEALACGLPVMCSPETAFGSKVAEDYLVRAEVWPANPTRTASLWAASLDRLELPLGKSQDVLADLAKEAWSWAPLVKAYGRVFDMVKK